MPDHCADCCSCAREYRVFDDELVFLSTVSFFEKLNIKLINVKLTPPRIDFIMYEKLGHSIDNRNKLK